MVRPTFGLLLLAASDLAAYELASVGAHRASLRITDQVKGRFARDGVVVLRSIGDNLPSPLQRAGCPKTLEEYAGVESERQLAGGLACTLLS